MHTWTDDPLREVWKHLKFISYRENCKNLLVGRIPSGRTIIYNASDDSIDRKVTEITTCILQGIEYFNAANQVTINTSPLLIYYGILSLAKALIVANNRDKYIDDIKYHGLKTKTDDVLLKEFRADKDNWCIENEYVIRSGGVFPELSNVLNSNRVLPIDSVIRLKDCLSCVPEIKTFYEKIYQEHACSFNASVGLRNHPLADRIEFAISKNETCDDLFTMIPELATDFKLNKGKSSYFISNNYMRIEDIDYIKDYISCIGGRYFVCGIQYNTNSQMKRMIIDQILIDYIAMFILGEQVRYHQDLWNKAIRGEDNGTIGLIEMYIDIIKRRYPNEILNRLFGEEFSYGSPGYIM